MVFRKITEGIKDFAESYREPVHERSSDFSYTSIMAGIRNNILEPSLKDLDRELKDEIGPSLEEVVSRDYDRDSLSEIERAIVSANRGYAQSLVEEDIPEERAKINHAGFEGAEYVPEEHIQESIEFLDEEV